MNRHFYFVVAALALQCDNATALDFSVLIEKYRYQVLPQLVTRKRISLITISVI
jgi:hypothetical protein